MPATSSSASDPSSTTITSSRSATVWAARASRHRCKARGRSRVGTTTEINSWSFELSAPSGLASLGNSLDRRGVGGAELEEGLDELALFEVFRLSVDAPDVVLCTVDDVQRRQHRSPHGVILVVVSVETVSAARLQIFEPFEIVLQGRDCALEARVVHRIRPRNQHLDSIDDLARIDQADTSKLLGSELDRLLVGHLPDVVALEAEVLDTQARGSRPDHVFAPRAVVLHPAGTRVRIMEIDPVVRKRLVLGRHQGHEHQVPIPQLSRRGLYGRRRRRVEAEHELAQWDARDDGVDVMLEGVAVLAQDDAAHAAVRVLYRDTPLVEVDPDSSLFVARGERLPHLSRTEAWIAELFDQRRDVLPLESEHGQHRLAEGEVLDPLRRPERPDLRPRDPPDLLRVGAEECLVETASKPRRHPILERLGVIIAMAGRPEI